MATNTDEITFNEWHEKTSRDITLVTAGQSGTGKSTLVQNLLCLADNDAKAPVVAVQSPDPVTKEVKSFSNCINGMKITIVDMPSLAAASDDEEKKIIAELTKVTEGGADMLLYCANMGPSGSKLNDLDRKIVKLLTSAFTPEIWEKTILVLTFGNIVKERNQRHGITAKTPTVEAAMNNYAEAFEKILTNSTAQVKVIPVLNNGAELRSPKEIAAVAAGEMPGEEVLPGMKWDMCLYEEVLKKCKPDAIPLILKIILPDYVQKEAENGAKREIIRGIIGGAAAGAGVGALAGGVGAIFGAVVGAVSGAVAGGVGSGKYWRPTYHKNNEEGKRAQLLKEIKELRIKQSKTLKDK